jgi:hypothetical protein
VDQGPICRQQQIVDLAQPGLVQLLPVPKVRESQTGKPRPGKRLSTALASFFKCVKQKRGALGNMLIESFDDALRQRRHHRRKLNLGNKRQRRVARALNKCRRHVRCGSEACRVCMREFRIGWVAEATKIMVQQPHWTRCSIVSKGLRVRYGALSTFDLKSEIKRLRKRIQRSALNRRIVLGALDVSLNLEKNKIKGWQWHLYLIVEGENDKALRGAIKSAFPSAPKALVPYDFQQINGSDYLKVATYAYKSVFKRRSGYTDSQGNHRTKDLPLKGDDLRILLPFLAQHKVGSRLLLAGVRRNGQRLVFTTAHPVAMKSKAA